MFDKINLKDEYVTVIAEGRTVVSWYNREKNKVTEYTFLANLMNNCSVNIFSLTEIARDKKSIRHEESYLRSNRNKVLVNPTWFYDNEVGEAIINHIKEVTESEKELWKFIKQKMVSKLQSEG